MQRIVSGDITKGERERERGREERERERRGGWREGGREGGREGWEGGREGGGEGGREGIVGFVGLNVDPVDALTNRIYCYDFPWLHPGK